MSAKSKQNAVAKELRKRGYVPIPRWWVTPDELEVIRRMAHNHQDEIDEVRDSVSTD